MRAAGLVLAGLLAAGCLGATTESRAPIDIGTPGTWSILARMPTARQEVAAAALDGRVFVIGGFGSTAEPVASVEVFDPVQNRWELRMPMPVALHHAAAGVVDNRLFVVGGYSGGRVNWTAEASMYEYDLARNRWIERAPMPTPRGALAVAVMDGRLHAIGGAADKPSNAHEVYDPATNRWTGAAPLPVSRDHLAAVTFQGRVWAIGGRSGFLGKQYANVDVYDPPSDRWITGPPLPVGRGGLAAAVVGDAIFVFGGEAPLRIFNATEMYEVGGNRWIAKAPMPTARHGMGAVAIDGRIYVPAGGTEPGFARSAANEAFRP